MFLKLSSNFNNVKNIPYSYIIMSYKITMYRVEGEKLLEDSGKKHLLNIEETEKAVLVFEADMFVCRLFIDLTDARFGDRAEVIRADLREGNDLAEEDRVVLDDIFEDILTFVEFYENLLTCQGDPAMARLMTHVRFSAALLLRIDQSRSQYHKHSRSNKKMNSAIFRHDSKDEVQDIYHLNYSRDMKQSISGTALDYKSVMNELDAGSKEEVISYYYDIISDMMGHSRHFNVRIQNEEVGIWDALIEGEILFYRGSPYVPLFKLVDVLVKNLPEIYQRYIFLDFKYMIHNVLSVCVPATGKVGGRDNSLNTAQKEPSVLPASYGVEVLGKEIMSIRVTDMIFGCSSVSHKTLDFSFSILGTMRLLDPWLFGWKYDLLPVLFCMDSKDSYDKFMRKHDMITTDNAVVVDWVKNVQSDWRTGKRMWAGNRVPGGLFKFSSVDYVSPDGLEDYMKKVKEPTTIVISMERMDEILAYLCSFTTVAERAKVGSIFIVCPHENFIFSGTIVPYSSVVLVKEERLMDILTMHNIRLIELAISDYQYAMSSELGITPEELFKVEPVDLKTACYRKFMDEVDKARNVLADYRKLLDHLD